ncbi:SET domain-containing protein [Haematococcus lacustris]|uniref:SET domain-containing protein n=1 Tax=Haematococcus lacustris TaxID=44745 RepID=A0A699YVL0_HAELA|nr:SET domain-containing protein [Haematococcus lacustris]
MAVIDTGLVAIVQVPGQGRGLFASQPIDYGTEVLREQPMVCYPAPTVLDQVDRS